MRSVKDINVDELNTIEDLNRAEIEVLKFIAACEGQLDDREESEELKPWRNKCKTAIRLAKITLRQIEQKQENFYE